MTDSRCSTRLIATGGIDQDHIEAQLASGDGVREIGCRDCRQFRRRRFTGLIPSLGSALGVHIQNQSSRTLFFGGSRTGQGKSGLTTAAFLSDKSDDAHPCKISSCFEWMQG